MESARRVAMLHAKSAAPHSGMAKPGCRSEREQAEGHAEGERCADVAQGPGKARGFHPANLVLERAGEIRVQDHVVDGVVAEGDGLAELVGLVAEDEIVGAVVGGDAEAAHPADGFAAEGHGGAERELHALHGASGKDTGRHFDGHADGLEARPEAAPDPILRGDAAIEAAHAADALVSEGEGHWRGGSPA
jgi:hypothetical protein